jgi:hypothetical protein
MGFNKRIFTKKHILRHLDDIEKYLDVDAAFLTDKFSRDVYRLFNEGKTIEVKLKLLKVKFLWN